MAKTDWSWDQHKYKAKEWVNGKWQYIYNTAKDTSKKVKDTANQASKTAKVYVNNGRNAITNAYNTGKSAVNNAYNTSKNAVTNAYNIGRSAITTASDKVREQTNAGIDKVKDKVNSEIEAIKQAKEEAKRLVEENSKMGVLPAAAVVGLGILGLIATRFLITAAALAYASNEAAKNAKSWNADNIIQRKKAKEDTRETQAKPASESQKDAIVEKINKNYNPNSNDGWANNCYSCTMAYDLNRRGYDADAIFDTDGATYDTIAGCYKNENTVDIGAKNPQKRFTEDEAKKIIDDMANDYPDGAYGNMCLTWSPPYGLVGGHSIVWEKEDGKIVFRDCQTNKIYKSDEEVYSVLKLAGSAQYFRADNVDLDSSISFYTKTNGTK